ncbi:hypothetical protein JCM8097_004686 [Rhodosporidiobolus ruineniae]
MVPDPFAPSSYTRRQAPHLAQPAHSPDDDDTAYDYDSDSLSAASSVTAHGGASLELARVKAALSFDGEDEEGDEKGERERLVREGEGLTEGEMEQGDGRGGGKKRERRIKRRRLALLALTSTLLLFSLLFLLSLRPSSSSSLLSSSSTSAHPHRFEGKGLKKLSLEELKNGTWWTERVEVEWVAEAGDGVFSTRTDDGSIVLTDVNANTSRVLVRGEDVRDPRDGGQLQWNTFKLSPDMQFIVFSTDYVKQWRHSSLSTFHLHRISPPLTLYLLPSSVLSSPSALQSTYSRPLTNLVLWSPTDHTLGFVHERDVYVLPAEGIDGAFGEGRGLWERAVRVTEDGGVERFNGVCDWVYEEEVFSSPLALFFSPTSAHLAFLSFDESAVPSYDFPIYNHDLNGWEKEEGGADEYESWVRMRYPKAGYPNPLVSVRLFRLSSYLSSSALSRPTLASSSSGSAEAPVEPYLSELVLARPFPDEDRLVTELAWVAEESLVVRQTSRDAGVERVGLFDLSAAGEVREGDGEGRVAGRVVREVDWVRRDGGWAEASQNIVPLLRPSSLSSNAPIPSYPPGYLDVLPSPKGYNHLAYFSPPDAGEPVWLTEGEWEIDGGALRVDLERGFVYLLAARPSIERHLLRVPLPRSQAALDALRSGKARVEPPVQLSEGGEDGKKRQGQGGERTRGVYSASFSPGGGVYLLNYEGPDLPWQKLFKVDDPDYVLPFTLNTALRTLDESYAHAEIAYSTLKIPDTDPARPASEGGGKSVEVEVNVMEMRPPLMDVSGRTKYPVLFQVYGGPSSQLVTPRWQRDFQHYLCTSLGYIVVRIDPRGTGFKGRRFRTTVRGRLGEVERADVVEAAREWAGRGYVDEKRVGIWGWSYGGFLTTKVIEANSSVFQLGMAVAPVTDWRYYDSVYTERYMSTPQLNPQGYRNSSVHEMDGFKHAVYALAHGTGDDNVHFQNTANLLDRFTVAGVRDFHLRIFPDSDHSISTRNAYWELMAWLEGNLLEHFGIGGRTKQRWKMTAGDRHVDRERERERERE